MTSVSMLDHPRVAASARGCRRLTGIAAAVWLMLVLAGGVIAVWPEAGTPLIGSDGWAISKGFFQNIRPSVADVRGFVLAMPQARFWRSWSPETNATTGRIETVPFTPPRYLLVPYNMAPNDWGTHLYLSCARTGSQKVLGLANTNNDWGEALVEIRPGWCPGEVKVIGTTTSHALFFSVGTPFAVTFITWLKISLPTIIFMHASAFALIAGCFLAFTEFPSRLSSPLMAAGQGAVGLGVTGLCAFYTFWIDRALGIGCLGFASIVILKLVPRLRGGLRLAAEDGIGQAVILWYAVTLAYVLLLFCVDNGGASWLPNARFDPVNWSSDNQLPQIVADGLFDGKPMRRLLGTGWQVSDRPPLLSGLLVALRTLAEPMMRLGMSHPLMRMWYHIGGTVANGLWVPVMGLAFRALSTERRGWLTPTLLLALLPFTLFNTVYIWPKMIGGAFGSLALLILLAENVGPGSETALTSRTGALVGVLCGLALMSHGGAFFALFVVAVWFALRHSRRALQLAPSALLAFVLIVLPWILWQRYVDPPGNALTKFAFAGTFGMDEREVGVLDTVLRAYRQLTLARWMDAKGDAVLTLLGLKASQCGAGSMRMIVGAPLVLRLDTASLGVHRIWDFMYVLPSFGMWWLGLPPLVLPRLLNSSWQEAMRRNALMLLGLGVATLLLTAVVSWGCMIVHHQSYEAMLAIGLGLCLGIDRAKAAYRLPTMLLCIGYSFVVWVISPLLLQDEVICLTALAGFVVVVLGLTIACVLAERPRDADHVVE